MEELGDFEYFNERYVDDCFQFKKLKYAILGDLAHVCHFLVFLTRSANFALSFRFSSSWRLCGHPLSFPS